MSIRLSTAVAAASIALLAGECAFAFDASTEAAAVKASNAFAFDFYLQSRKGQGNFVCSPAGATLALTMLAAGSHGETQTEILRVLHIARGRYDEWLAAIVSQEVDLALPRFSTTTALPLVDVLEAMGMAQAFDPQQARFGSMASLAAEEAVRPNPYVGDAIQKTRIETEATVVEGPFKKRGDYDPLAESGLRPPPVRFHANHPFVYLVRDVKSGAILFMGRVVKPAS